MCPPTVPDDERLAGHRRGVCWIFWRDTAGTCASERLCSLGSSEVGGEGRRFEPSALSVDPWLTLPLPWRPPPAASHPRLLRSSGARTSSTSKSPSASDPAIPALPARLAALRLFPLLLAVVVRSRQIFSFTTRTFSSKCLGRAPAGYLSPASRAPTMSSSAVTVLHSFSRTEPSGSLSEGSWPSRGLPLMWWDRSCDLKAILRRRSSGGVQRRRRQMTAFVGSGGKGILSRGETVVRWCGIGHKPWALEVLAKWQGGEIGELALEHGGCGHMAGRTGWRTSERAMVTTMCHDHGPCHRSEQGRREGKGVIRAHRRKKSLHAPVKLLVIRTWYSPTSSHASQSSFNIAPASSHATKSLPMAA